jgi:hypothetical protein
MILGHLSVLHPSFLLIDDEQQMCYHHSFIPLYLNKSRAFSWYTKCLPQILKQIHFQPLEDRVAAKLVPWIGKHATMADRIK